MAFGEVFSPENELNGLIFGQCVDMCNIQKTQKGFEIFWFLAILWAFLMVNSGRFLMLAKIST